MLEKIEEMQNINFEYLIMINFNVAVLPSCRHLKEGSFKTSYQNDKVYSLLMLGKIEEMQNINFE